MQYKAIIPCAGFGTRMGMNPDLSKEMLTDPSTDQPLIQYSLNLCLQYGLKPVIITRPEKQDLIDYLQDKGVELQIEEPGKEWAETVLKTEKNWGTHNIVMLPDCKFGPHKIIEQMMFNIVTNDLVFALHELPEHGSTPETTNWGIVTPHKTAEKPKNYSQLYGPYYAWGLIGFKKSRGKALFQTYTEKGKWFDLNNEKCSFLFLDAYRDITRTGKIE